MHRVAIDGTDFIARYDGQVWCARQKGPNCALPADGDVTGVAVRGGIGPTDGDILLFAACPPPEDLGFEPATGHWRKQLPISEVQAVWESRPVGTFRGERCMVLDDLGDRLHIGYLGHNGYQAEQLGYWQVDRGVYELVAARSEVSDIIEERTEYPRHGATPAGPEAYAQPGGYPPPGSPQDQAQYLPPEPRDQASYLLGQPDSCGRRTRPAINGRPRRATSRPGRSVASSPGLIPVCRRSIRPVRSWTVRAHTAASVRPNPGPVRAHTAASVRPHPGPIHAANAAPVRPLPGPVRAHGTAPVRPDPRSVYAADAAGPGLPVEPRARQRRGRARADGASAAAGSRRAARCHRLPAAAGRPPACQ